MAWREVTVVESLAEAAGRIVGHVVAVQSGTVAALLTASGDGEAGAIGDLVTMPTSQGRAFGIVHALRKGRRGVDRPAAEIQLLG